MMRLTYLSILGIALCACGQGADRGKATDTAIRGGEVAPRPLTPAELKLFAPLPAVMAPPGMERTPAQIALGRRLFHESVLSNGHDLSCNSCHALNGYGADGRKVSFGDLGHAGDRNAPSVYNAAGQVAQFWDGRSPNVEEQAKGPILNPHEMAMPDSNAVLAHMRSSADYRAAFAAAFPAEREPITYENVGTAIGAFERGLVTPSRWDRYLAGDHRALSADEQRGLATFIRVGCVSCHSGPYVGGLLFRKLGAVKPWPTAKDSGRYLVTKDPADLFVFKVPSLRNVDKTAPYFHDGSVASLDSAIRMMGHYQLGVDLTDAQVRDIRTWLSSLTGELPAAYIAQPPRP
jgi:cytochrome c peroxidase